MGLRPNSYSYFLLLLVSADVAPFLYKENYWLSKGSLWVIFAKIYLLLPGKFTCYFQAKSIPYLPINFLPYFWLELAFINYSVISLGQIELSLFYTQKNIEY